MNEEFSFDFLNDFELEEVSASSTGAKFGGVDKNPASADIRLFADGRVYPSVELVKEFNLEYCKKDSADTEMGFDVFETHHWGQYQSAKKAYEKRTGRKMPEMLIISPVSKHSPKVSLFGSTTYDKDGKPKSSVLSQGAATFGKELIDMINTVEGEDVFEDGKMFVDLKINRDQPLPKTRNGIYNIPKKVTKGKNAGKISYTRRENTEFYPLTLVRHETSGIGADNSLRSQLNAQEGGQYADEKLKTSIDV